MAERTYKKITGNHDKRWILPRIQFIVFLLKHEADPRLVKTNISSLLNFRVKPFCRELCTRTLKDLRDRLAEFNCVTLNKLSPTEISGIRTLPPEQLQIIQERQQDLLEEIDSCSAFFESLSTCAEVFEQCQEALIVDINSELTPSDFDCLCHEINEAKKTFDSQRITYECFHDYSRRFFSAKRPSGPEPTAGKYHQELLIATVEESDILCFYRECYELEQMGCRLTALFNLAAILDNEQREPLLLRMNRLCSLGQHVMRFENLIGDWRKARLLDAQPVPSPTQSATTLNM